MDWMCLLYYVLACLGGAILSWLIFNKRGENDILLKESSQSKATLNKLLTEFNTYKQDSKAKIYTKDAEISLLKKKLTSAEVNDKSSDNGKIAKELTEQKTKYRTLQNKLLLMETTRPKTIDSHDRALKELNDELAEHRVIIEDKNATITRMRTELQEAATLTEAADNPETDSAASLEIQKLKKQRKKLRKKLREMQAQSNAETLDIDKLISLLKKGDLTKNRKTKPSFRSKTKSKSKPKRKNPA